jgi:hypothetical protein
MLKMQKKIISSVVFMLVGSLLLTTLGFAQAESEAAFGIRPTKALPDKPETFSYFSYELNPGVVVTDEALVMNHSDFPLQLNLYAVDAITAQNTGTTFVKQGQETMGASKGTGQWIELSQTDLSLEPNEDLVIPFTITIPEDASPGHHVAGLVVEAPISEDDAGNDGSEAQFEVALIRRIGVAVVIDVPGPHIAGLEITGAGLKQQDENGATFIIAIHNTGNIYLKGDGTLQINDLNGNNLALIPVKMDTILPGDSVFLYVTYPIQMEDGEYLIDISLNYEDQTTSLEGLEVTVIDGQPEADAEEITLPPALVEIMGSPLDESMFSINDYILLGALLLALLLAILLLIILLLRRRNQSAQYVESRHPAYRASQMQHHAKHPMQQRTSYRGKNSAVHRPGEK